MRRNRDEMRERRALQLFARLYRRSPAIGEHQLRVLARAATGGPRALVPRARRWPLAGRWIGVAVVVALALGLGVGLGSSLIASGTAAQGPLGLGFLPVEGWNVLQSGARATSERPAYSVAANLPIDREDVVAGGLPDPSGLPYATLVKLQPDGIVIVASFTKRLGPQPYYVDSRFPARELPLRLADGSPFVEYGTQIRPDEPLGQYQIRAFVSGVDVDVIVYFGTPRPSPTLLAEAQRQLDRLVVSAPKERPAATTRPDAIAAPRVIDRTVVCATLLTGGLRKVEVRGHAGIREAASSWKQLPFAVFSTGSIGARLTALDNSLTWITAGEPSGTTTMDIGFNLAWPHTTGTVAVNRRWCRTSSANVSLARSGLSGGPVGPFGADYDCAAPRRVVVRMRAELQGSSSLHGDGPFLRTNTPLRTARIAMRTESGQPLAYAEVLESGRARLFTARRCTPG